MFRGKQEPQRRGLGPDNQSPECTGLGLDQSLQAYSITVLVT